jgi:hypothetical protein
MKMHKRENPSFPNEKVFQRFGSKEDLIRKVLAYCAAHPGNDDVAAICAPLADLSAPEAATESGDFETGYVYLALMKIGRVKCYKIGKTILVDRRMRQIGPKLPADLELIHAITTDDAYGIEAYWHNRFRKKNRNGEWFELTAEDVRTFQRRKFM